MAVYHCPVCPLIFEFRTEVEWHLREQHRSRADEEADLRAEINAAVRQLDWLTLRALRSAAPGPAVSLLLATGPAPAMSVLDVARLRQLADGPDGASLRSRITGRRSPCWIIAWPGRWPPPKADRRTRPGPVREPP